MIYLFYFIIITLFLMVVNLFRDRNVKNGSFLVIFSIAFSKIHKKIKKYCISSCIGAKNMLY